jgi:hypothetical protein
MINFYQPSTLVIHEPARARCTCGKARYATEGEARRAVKRMRYKGRDRSYEGLLHPYMCPERKGIYHVGHDKEDC